MFPDDLQQRAARLHEQLRSHELKLASAESCTGGLIAALMTELAGSSTVFERAFVTYTNAAKSEMIGVPAALIAAHGAVSREVAVAMAEGALRASRADIAVSVTGLAGPGGGTELKPIGLVHIAAARAGHPTRHEECRFGSIGRSQIRLAALARALTLVEETIASG